MIIKTFLETAGNFDEREILTRFHSGIKESMYKNFPREYDDFLSDDKGIYLSLHSDYSHCDVAVMLGSWKNRDNSHHIVRQNVVKSSQCFVVVETPILGRSTSEKNKQFRVGVNGFLNNSGIFRIMDHPSDRLKALNITWDSWKNDPNGYVLLMLQLPGDASLRSINLYDWARYCIENIKKYSNRKIVIRTHPHHNIKDTDEFYKFVSTTLINEKNVSVSSGKDVSLIDDLKGAYCTVTYSSGSGVDSIINGIPTIASDPGNFAWDISSKYVSEIENIFKAGTADVQQWLNNLAYSQWSVEEMESGKVWDHLFPVIQKVLAQLPPTKKKK